MRCVLEMVKLIVETGNSYEASVESRKELIEIPSSAPLSMSDSFTVMSNEGNSASENIRSPLCNNRMSILLLILNIVVFRQGQEELLGLLTG